jgi:hypothetical protein
MSSPEGMVTNNYLKYVAMTNKSTKCCRQQDLVGRALLYEFGGSSPHNLLSNTSNSKYFYTSSGIFNKQV